MYLFTQDVHSFPVCNYFLGNQQWISYICVGLAVEISHEDLLLASVYPHESNNCKIVNLRNETKATLSCFHCISVFLAFKYWKREIQPACQKENSSRLLQVP